MQESMFSKFCIILYITVATKIWQEATFMLTQMKNKLVKPFRVSVPFHQSNAFFFGSFGR